LVAGKKYYNARRILKSNGYGKRLALPEEKRRMERFEEVKITADHLAEIVDNLL